MLTPIDNEPSEDPFLEHGQGQQESSSPLFRSISRSLKIRVRLGGSPDPFEPFPERPRGMHRRTYLRLREQAEAAEASKFGGFSSVPPAAASASRRQRSVPGLVILQASE
jgi:hypothetical protein